jgi:hypothetical protein
MTSGGVNLIEMVQCHLFSTLQSMICAQTRKGAGRRKVSRPALLLVVVAALTVIVGPPRAQGTDTIYFKDGTRTFCEGTAREKNDEVHCEYDGGLLIYRKSDVDSIERGRSAGVENAAKPALEVEPGPVHPRAAGPSPIPEPALSAAPDRLSGSAFYDPRRPKKYWSSETRHHDTLSEAIAALAEEFNRPAAWVAEHMGDSNQLSDVRASIAAGLAQPASGAAGPDPPQGAGIAFYDPRRPQKYMTGPDGRHNSFKEAVEALAGEFDRPAGWVERHMGDSNDVDQIRQNLRNAQNAERTP